MRYAFSSTDAVSSLFFPMTLNEDEAALGCFCNKKPKFPSKTDTIDCVTGSSAQPGVGVEVIIRVSRGPRCVSSRSVKVKI